MRISSYIKKLPFFQLGEGVYPQLCQSVLVLFICLIYRFSIPLRYFTHIVSILFVEGIFCGLVRIFIPNSGTFSFVRKKKKQTDKQRNKHKFENRLSRQAGRGALIFFVRGADVYWRCQKIYPQQWNIFICAEKKKQTDKQRNKHKFENRFSRQAGGRGGR